MGSDGKNQMNDGTGIPPSEPVLCANGCGFFGSPANMNLCSKCFRDMRITEEQVVSAQAAMDSAQAAMEKVVSQNQKGQATPVADGFCLDTHVGSSSAAESPPAAVSEPESVEPGPANRCFCCRKKVGVLGFKCKCGRTFCGNHRYPEKHECGVDFKTIGRSAIAKANPVVKADKIDRI
ncbi:hypothetical protein RJ640_027226 [Escallonia rubra]|uniref:Uncharacterized protein n=1 Tax=Escallonia rubra TaxID=112253 RepID=A0AA88RHJ3_9ASTE|nr:hypothetical protein RJ640_027226 [Escallonia rubra]